MVSCLVHGERGCYGISHPTLPFMCHLTMVLSFYGRPSLLPHTPWLWPHHTPAPSGCLHAANTSPLPRSDLQSLTFSIQPLPIPAEARLRLGHSEQWQGLSVQVSLCSACHRPVAALSSKPLKPPSTACRLISLVRGLPRVWEHFLFYSFFPGVQVTARFLFFSLLLFYPVMWRSFLSFQVSEVSSSAQ